MVLVFKTSVANPQEVEQLRPKFYALLPELKWTFDLEDSDRILRVEGPYLRAEQIVRLLNYYHYDCQELS